MNKSSSSCGMLAGGSESSVESMISSSASTSNSVASGIPVVRHWKRQRTLPEMLAMRQTLGTPSKASRTSCAPQHIPTSILSYKGAWNPSRLQNMILAVGPGTPAALLWSSMEPSAPASSSESSSSGSSSSDDQTGESSEDPNSNDDSQMQESNDDDEEEDHDDNVRPGRARYARRSRADRDDDSDDDDDSLDPNWEDDIIRLGNHSEDGGDDVSDIRSEKGPTPSMRHGGCINTATWLDCGWRLSTVGTLCEGVESLECPTQLVTSGDDHLVKFWDVRHAMGTTSPVHGSYPTLCPFSAPNVSSLDEARKTWRTHYSKTNSLHLAGQVLPLATLRTGHHGNIFHVTPLHGKPGKVATCGADGFLRLSDMEAGSTSIVVSPDTSDDGGLLPSVLLSLRASMCFSHHFLNANTGLLCTERGLRRFDIRLPPREQPSQNILAGSFRGCKACAIWSSPKTAASLEDGEPSYVFAGGSSADVALCDLRMTDSSASRVVLRYRPNDLSDADNVSVSGLDLSGDRQELLVSYESDQIYTFPVFPQFTSPSGPTVDQIQTLTDSKRGKVLSELAAYGGHLNRYTFLKNAKYAGPRDEYICTGSDSGHAWIYEKATGSVVSFLNADHSTCNGVVPHPSLPIFITYGIDSTAKLWRATIPVDDKVDDSLEGRQKNYRESNYEMTPSVQKWDDVQQILKVLETEDYGDADILPDNIPSTKVVMRRGSRHFIRFDGRRICNDLHNLPDTLRQNLYSCLRSQVECDDMPVESGVVALKRRVSLIRLRHQADRLGLRWNPSIPWAFDEPTPAKKMDSNSEIHPADMVPDCPSDWIPFDPEMCKSAWDFNNYFNLKNFGDFYAEHYPHLRGIPVRDEVASGSSTSESKSRENYQEASDVETTELDSDEDNTTRSVSNMASSPSDERHDEKYLLSVYTLLYETMFLLKNAGNQALQAGDWDLAARRYDKAIQYGAVASMCFPVHGLDFAKGRREELKDNGWFHLEWTPLRRVLIITRLNLGLLMLKSHFSRPLDAVEQTTLAIHDLSPFCVCKGKVMKGSTLKTVHREDEPEETFTDAVVLKSKAFFRRGSAHSELGNYDKAISDYEESVRCTLLANEKTDKLVLKRLSDAKRLSRRQAKRHRKKFKIAFGGTNENQKNPP